MDLEPVGRELSAKQREKLGFIWSVKETLRDHSKRHQYQYPDVILPFCVRRGGVHGLRDVA